MKKFIIKLSNDLFQTKIEIEKELAEKNKTNEKLYLLILKAINFLMAERKGEPISKKLPIYKYFENRFSITNLFLIELSKEARGFYTNVSQDEFKILQIILEIHETHKEYEKKGDILNINMSDKITKQKIDKYRKLSEKAFEIAKKNIAKKDEAKKIIEMVCCYLSDSKYFEERENLVNAFAAINYAHGWLDCGARLKIFNVKDNKLFTVC